ncbi:unnamed protein product [Didymodactylos carnosus]|uniref:Ribosomal RNA-processing protein 7 C-terminal domain-containing protein n=1 Tax=Didymodactylos carnosus TaxID=1234261 RepID=A0A814G478_9BILA|nr:unnamed protein product [Didymodactylos carnosus]CAF3763480.1 unnamed protein product [Didymodactylos carnosus]
MKINQNKKFVKRTKIDNTDEGLNKWIQSYIKQFSTDINQLENESRNYLEEYERKLNEENDKEKQSSNGNDTTNQIDDDSGWTLVTKKMKKTRQRSVPSTDNMMKKLYEKQKRQNKQKELLNFYKFQLTDKKLDAMKQLKEKFELDKQKIMTMRANRKFKPF